KGKATRKIDIIKATEKDFTSARGPLRFGSNLFAVQNFYLLDVVKGLMRRLCSGSSHSWRMRWGGARFLRFKQVRHGAGADPNRMLMGRLTSRIGGRSPSGAAADPGGRTLCASHTRGYGDELRQCRSSCRSVRVQQCGGVLRSTDRDP